MYWNVKNQIRNDRSYYKYYSKEIMKEKFKYDK